MTRSLLVHAACLITLTVGVGACGRSSAADAKASAASTPAKPSAVSVDVATVESRPLQTIVPLPGELQPYESVPMFPRVSGFVKSIAVDRGTRVKEGQIIIKLEAPELLAQRAEAQAKLQGAQAQLAAAEARRAGDDGTYQRLKAASATPGVVAGNELEIAQKTVDADQAQVKAQRDTVDAATQALGALADVAGYLDVRAPFDGIVTARNVHPGALVGPGGSASGAMPMVTIERVSCLRLVVPVPQTYVAGIREGRDVEFTVPAYPGRTFTGTVARVAQSLDVKTRTMPVELDVANTSGALAPGTFSDVRWPVERPEPSLFVPTTAVTSTLERTFVVRITAGKAEWVDAKTGVTTGKLIEVFGNLRAGDQVAVRGTDELRPDTLVSPRVTPTRP